jgi:hypothetical protein
MQPGSNVRLSLLACVSVVKLATINVVGSSPTRTALHVVIVPMNRQVTIDPYSQITFVNTRFKASSVNLRTMSLAKFDGKTLHDVFHWPLPNK